VGMVSSVTMTSCTIALPLGCTLTDDDDNLSIEILVA